MSKKINMDDWTPERFKTELIDERTGKNKPFTEENKKALYSLSRQEALQLDPRIFARWNLAKNNKEITNKAGKNSVKRRKEVKDWSIKVRELLGDPEIAQLMLNQKKLPRWLNVLEDPTAADVIVATLIAKAMTGDVRAVEELRKMGFGDKVVIDAGNSFFSKNALKLEIVQPTVTPDKSLIEPDAAPIQQEPDKREPMPLAPNTPPEIKNLPMTPEQDGGTMLFDSKLEAEYQRQEESLRQPQPPAKDHGIDPSILKGMVITKNLRRQ